jgi:predicted ATPase/signal transduction histidine kinase
MLVAAFDRVVAGGRPELVLVSGYSGIGKSAVVGELHRPLVPPRGLFASGKFDQYKRDIPYATIAQVFQSLLRPLLSKPDDELRRWRDDLLAAMGSNAALLIDLVPELRLIIGEQPALIPLPPQEAKIRAQVTFRRFISVFARSEHPLALFLDDLQWLDAATLDVLEDLLVQDDLSHLLVIGAYRDNEVDATHPLVRRLSAIRAAGGTIEEIRLAPLRADDLAHLIVDTFNCETDRAATLGELIREKTAGNPFFAVQFIHALIEDGLIAFARAHWLWDLHAIRAKGHTDNVVDFMVAKLNRLRSSTRSALQQLASIGNGADTATLCAVLETTESETEAELWEALHLELITRTEGSYRFVHDRVQEAAYSLVTGEDRAATHLRIGRVLSALTPAEKLEESIFEIVSHLNRGAGLITADDERFRLAELNLIAGKRGKASSAYAAALQYLIAGAALLTDDCWESRYDLIFALEVHRAECEMLTGELSAAAVRVDMLLSRAATTVDLAVAACLGIDGYMALGQVHGAVTICLDYMQRLGIDWPIHPTDEQVRNEYKQVWSQLGGREIEEVLSFPRMTDPTSIATMSVLSRALAAALFADWNLLALVVCRGVSLSIERGNDHASCLDYVWLGIIAGHGFGDFENAFRFGRVGFQLVEQQNLTGSLPSTYIAFAARIMPWMAHPARCCDVIREAYDVANRSGDATHSAFAYVWLGDLLMATGNPLADVQRETESGLNVIRKSKFNVPVDMILVQVALIKTLRGLTATFGSFDHDELDESLFERELTGKPERLHCWYWIRKLQARVFAGDFATAVAAAAKAQPLLSKSPSIEWAEYEFYAALARAALCDSTVAVSHRHFDALTQHHAMLQVWAEHRPETFAARSALIGAEIARFAGSILEAEQLYEQAIRLAQLHGFVHDEAIIHEFAARFYEARGLESIARACLRNARNCYDAWGADGKVKQLEGRFPYLRAQAPGSPATATIDRPAVEFDAEAVVRASQALSSEINLSNLIEKLMRLALEYAGAERGLLMLMHDDEPRVEAEARAGRDGVEIFTRGSAVAAGDMPESVLQYVLRTHEQVLRHDATSVLCLPILKQSALIGLLYLENKLTGHAFTSGRVAVLHVLASQAAISLENAQLYASLERSEALLTEAQLLSFTGSFLWRLATDEITWSRQTYHIFGYEPGITPTLELIGARFHPDDVPFHRIMHEQARGPGGDLDYEFRLRMPDGSIKYIHFVAHEVYNQLNEREYIGAIQDVTERRLSEVALERTRSELAHVSRVSTLGNLSASIAHELNQPLSGVIMNANTALRRLASEPPNIEGVAETTRRVIRDAKRAADIINRLRALFTKGDTVVESVDLNDAIREIVALSQSDFQVNGVTLRAEYLDDLPHAAGDRVQLQQVILNLLRNAMDAMSEVDDRPRHLLVKTETDEDGRVRVSIMDSGIGFGDDGPDSLFNAFYTTKSNGMGMGLSVSRSIIESHNGRLWAIPNDGPGVTFSFALPTDAGEQR